MVMTIKIEVHISTQEQPLAIECGSNTLAEEFCIIVLKSLNISQIGSTLFALKLCDSPIYLPPNAPVEKYNSLILRIRYRVPSLSRLRSLDPKIYDFYFHQIRQDVLENRIPEIVYAKHRNDLLGLGVTDMYRVMLEQNMECSEMEKNYRKYIPKEVLRKHHIFTRKPILAALTRLKNTVRNPSGNCVEGIKDFNTLEFLIFEETPAYALELLEFSISFIRLSPEN